MNSVQQNKLNLISGEKMNIFKRVKFFWRRMRNIQKNKRCLANGLMNELEFEFIAARGVHKFSMSYIAEHNSTFHANKQSCYLTQAIKTGSLAEIKDLINSGGCVDQSDALLYAVLYGRCEAITYFLIEKNTLVDEYAGYLFKSYLDHPNSSISRGAKHVCDILNKGTLYDSLSNDLKPKNETATQSKRVKL